MEDKKKGAYYMSFIIIDGQAHIQMISKQICTSVLHLINMQLFDILSSETNHNEKNKIKQKPE